MEDIDIIEDIGSGLRVKKGELTETESWVYSVPADDLNFKGAVDRLTVEECDHLLQLLTQDSKLKAVAKRRLELVGEDIPETSPGRTLAAPESWDNTGFRERLAEILAKAEYPIVDVDKIIFPTDGRGKFQYRRYRANDKLFDSILKSGVFGEITLQGTPDLTYHVIDGNSRLKEWFRAREIDPSIPQPIFRVLEISDADAAQLAVELNRFGQNLDDEDLHALVIRLVEEAGIKQKDIAIQLEMSESYISDIVSAFQKVPEEARALIENRRWTVKHGRHLARLYDYPNDQQRVMNSAIKGGWATNELEESVKKALLHHEFEKKSSEIIDDVVPTGSPGEAIKEIRVSQVDKIHTELIKKLGSPSSKGYGGKRVLKDGQVEVSPKIATTKKVLKSAGYLIIPDPVQKPKTDSGEKSGPEIPTMAPAMPTKEELMDVQFEGQYICSECGGPTHPVISETFGFNTVDDYRGYGKGYGQNHLHCRMKDQLQDLKDELVELQKDIAEKEKELKKESVSKLLEKGKTLTQFHNEGHAVYKEELERRKQSWKDEHLPDPKDLVKKGPHAGEPIKKKPKDQLALLEKVRKKQPDLIPKHYWDPIAEHLKESEGYKTQTETAAVIGVSQQSLYNQLKKVTKAINALE